MYNYLVVTFNRYETENSTNVMVRADSPFDALMKNDPSLVNNTEACKWIEESLISVNDTFSCIPGEEEELLVYKIVIQ